MQPINLSFTIPTPIPTISGDKLVQVQDGSGRYACLFAYIHGKKHTSTYAADWIPSKVCRSGLFTAT
ncbi:hypothetical protein [Paenibacillus solani]|uniref:hypothetical protein n=1 Tax=Paenibacillus solani TaxID=1705565 RepID=UPI003D299D70